MVVALRVSRALDWRRASVFPSDHRHDDRIQVTLQTREITPHFDWWRTMVISGKSILFILRSLEILYDF